MLFYSNRIYKELNRFLRLLSLVKTQFWYKIFFKNIGNKTKIIKPILIENPQNISIGDNVLIRNNARIESIGNGQVVIGDNVSFEQSLHLISINSVFIGNYVTISFNVMITDVDHEYDDLNVDILSQRLISQKTSLGDYCFIGAGAKIQAGTVLGKQCIVGANAVVRGIFPDYCVIVGAPAKIVKRYDSTQKIWRRTDVKGNFL